MARAVSCLVIATAPLRIACSDMVPNSFLNRVAGTDRISTSSPSIRKYADRKIDFADATLIWLANHTGMRDILTVDETDFSVYRLKGGKRFVLVKWFE
jgi:predicted nucleic acid-binding protein